MAYPNWYIQLYGELVYDDEYQDAVYGLTLPADRAQFDAAKIDAIEQQRKQEKWHEQDAASPLYDKILAEMGLELKRCFDLHQAVQKDRILEPDAQLAEIQQRLGFGGGAGAGRLPDTIEPLFQRYQYHWRLLLERKGDKSSMSMMFAAQGDLLRAVGAEAGTDVAEGRFHISRGDVAAGDLLAALDTTIAVVTEGGASVDGLNRLWQATGKGKDSLFSEDYVFSIFGDKDEERQGVEIVRIGDDGNYRAVSLRDIVEEFPEQARPRVTALISALGSQNEIRLLVLTKLISQLHLQGLAAESKIRLVVFHDERHNRLLFNAYTYFSHGISPLGGGLVGASDTLFNNERVLGVISYACNYDITGDVALPITFKGELADIGIDVMPMTDAEVAERDAFVIEDRRLTAVQYVALSYSGERFIGNVPDAGRDDLFCYKESLARFLAIPEATTITDVDNFSAVGMQNLIMMTPFFDAEAGSDNGRDRDFVSALFDNYYVKNFSVEDIAQQLIVYALNNMADCKDYDRKNRLKNLIDIALDMRQKTAGDLPAHYGLVPADTKSQPVKIAAAIQETQWLLLALYREKDLGTTNLPVIRQLLAEPTLVYSRNAEYLDKFDEATARFTELEGLNQQLREVLLSKTSLTDDLDDDADDADREQVLTDFAVDLQNWQVVCAANKQIDDPAKRFYAGERRVKIALVHMRRTAGASPEEVAYLGIALDAFIDAADFNEVEAAVYQHPQLQPLLTGHKLLSGDAIKSFDDVVADFRSVWGVADGVPIPGELQALLDNYKREYTQFLGAACVGDDFAAAASILEEAYIELLLQSFKHFYLDVADAAAAKPTGLDDMFAELSPKFTAYITANLQDSLDDSARSAQFEEWMRILKEIQLKQQPAAVDAAVAAPAEAGVRDVLTNDAVFFGLAEQYRQADAKEDPALLPFVIEQLARDPAPVDAELARLNFLLAMAVDFRQQQLGLNKVAEPIPPYYAVATTAAPVDAAVASGKVEADAAGLAPRDAALQETQWLLAALHLHENLETNDLATQVLCREAAIIWQRNNHDDFAADAELTRLNERVEALLPTKYVPRKPGAKLAPQKLNALFTAQLALEPEQRSSAVVGQAGRYSRYVTQLVAQVPRYIPRYMEGGNNEGFFAYIAAANLCQQDLLAAGNEASFEQYQQVALTYPALSDWLEQYGMPEPEHLWALISEYSGEDGFSELKAVLDEYNAGHRQFFFAAFATAPDFNEPSDVDIDNVASRPPMGVSYQWQQWTEAFSSFAAKNRLNLIDKPDLIVMNNQHFQRSFIDAYVQFLNGEMLLVVGSRDPFAVICQGYLDDAKDPGAKKLEQFFKDLFRGMSFDGQACQLTSSLQGAKPRILAEAKIRMLDEFIRPIQADVAIKDKVKFLVATLMAQDTRNELIQKYLNIMFFLEGAPGRPNINHNMDVQYEDGDGEVVLIFKINVAYKRFKYIDESGAVKDAVVGDSAFVVNFKVVVNKVTGEIQPVTSDDLSMLNIALPSKSATAQLVFNQDLINPDEVAPVYVDQLEQLVRQHKAPFETFLGEAIDFSLIQMTPESGLMLLPFDDVTFTGDPAESSAFVDAFKDLIAKHTADHDLPAFTSDVLILFAQNADLVDVNWDRFAALKDFFDDLLPMVQPAADASAEEQRIYTVCHQIVMEMSADQVTFISHKLLVTTLGQMLQQLSGPAVVPGALTLHARLKQLVFTQLGERLFGSSAVTTPAEEAHIFRMCGYLDEFDDQVSLEQCVFDYVKAVAGDDYEHLDDVKVKVEVKLALELLLNRLPHGATATRTQNTKWRACGMLSALILEGDVAKDDIENQDLITHLRDFVLVEVNRLFANTKKEDGTTDVALKRLLSVNKDTLHNLAKQSIPEPVPEILVMAKELAQEYWKEKSADKKEMRQLKQHYLLSAELMLTDPETAAPQAVQDLDRRAKDKKLSSGKRFISAAIWSGRHPNLVAQRAAMKTQASAVQNNFKDEVEACVDDYPAALLFMDDAERLAALQLLSDGTKEGDQKAGALDAFLGHLRKAIGNDTDAVLDFVGELAAVAPAVGDARDDDQDSGLGAAAAGTAPAAAPAAIDPGLGFARLREDLDIRVGASAPVNQLLKDVMPGQGSAAVRYRKLIDDLVSRLLELKIEALEAGKALEEDPVIQALEAKVKKLLPESKNDVVKDPGPRIFSVAAELKMYKQLFVQEPGVVFNKLLNAGEIRELLKRKPKGIKYDLIGKYLGAVAAQRGSDGDWIRDLVEASLGLQYVPSDAASAAAVGVSDSSDGTAGGGAARTTSPWQRIALDPIAVTKLYNLRTVLADNFVLGIDQVTDDTIAGRCMQIHTAIGDIESDARAELVRIAAKVKEDAARAAESSSAASSAEELSLTAPSGVSSSDEDEDSEFSDASSSATASGSEYSDSTTSTAAALVPPGTVRPEQSAVRLELPYTAGDTIINLLKALRSLQFKITESDSGARFLSKPGRQDTLGDAQGTRVSRNGMTTTAEVTMKHIDLFYPAQTNEEENKQIREDVLKLARVLADAMSPGHQVKVDCDDKELQKALELMLNEDDAVDVKLSSAAKAEAGVAVSFHPKR